MTDALNAYLTSEYLYHWICMRCGNVAHLRPGVRGDACGNCGSDCWKTLVVNPHRPEPWYIQSLAPTCTTCKATLATINGIDAQMELFIV